MEDEAKDAAKDALGGLGDKAKDALGDKLPGGVGDKLGDAADGLGDKVAGAAGGLGDAAGGLGGKAAGAVGGVGAAGAGAAAMASGKMGDVTGKVGDMGGKVTGSVGSAADKVGSVGGRVEAPKATGGLPKWLIPLVLLIGLALLLWWLFSSVLGGGDDLEELNVAYFSEWPTPNQVDQFNETFDDELGIPVNWVSFGSGNDMSRAMEAGDIDISYSQGLTPFVNAVNEGSDFEMVGIAVSYTDNDNCVATGDANITPENASEALKGATIMSLLGNVTEFKMQKMLEFFGVDQSEVTIVGADDGAAVLAAYERGDIDVGCAFGGPLFEMLNSGGNFLWTGEEAEAAGVLVFDVTTIPAQFGADHPDVVTTFLQITEDANEKYKANAPYGPDIETLAQAAGLDVEGAQQNLDKFTFPDKAAQLGATWLGGGANEAMLRQGGDAALDDYQQFINTSFLEATE